MPGGRRQLLLLLPLVSSAGLCGGFVAPTWRLPARPQRAEGPRGATRAPFTGEETVDCVVVGSGLGGLCAASLLSSYGLSVSVCESHYHAGGAAHSFQVDGFHFDSGPSLFSGMSISPTPNPLKHVLNAIGEDVEWIKYDTWGVWLPEGKFPATVGPGPFKDILAQCAKEPDAQEQWDRLAAALRPLSEGTMGLPSFALRKDIGAALTLLPHAPLLLKTIAVGQKLQAPFSEVMDEVGLTDPFIRNWLNMLAFLLQGLPADGTMSAVMAYMLADWYRPGVCLDYPRGGCGALVDALIRGVEKSGKGTVRLNAHVESVMVEDGKAKGVRLSSGGTIHAKKAVISNATLWDTLSKLVPAGAIEDTAWLEERQKLPTCASFMHVHLGVDMTDLPTPLCHYCQVRSWDVPINTPGNVIIVSIPSVLDSSLAPDGCHSIHAYTAGNEPYDLWEGLDPKSSEYAKLKEERAAVLFEAIASSLGITVEELEKRSKVRMIGTPLTHERFLRRHRGTYGPEIVAGGPIPLPGTGTPLEGLVCVGDSCWPGIGMPAVASCGSLVANSLVSVWDHLGMIKRIDFGGAEDPSIELQ